jgi:hypothetical protein
MANRRFIDFPIAASVGNNDIVLIWQDGLNKQTTKATLLQGSPSSLAGLTDVDIAALTNGQILQYNSTTSKWENVDRTDINLSELGDVTIVAPANGQVLVYNSSTSKWENSSGGYVPYTGAVTTVNLGAQSILAGSFVRAGGTSAQFLKADGSVDSTAYGTGSVTSVALTMPTAFSVAGSPITTAGTLAVTGAGTVGQYIRGDGSLADFPATTGGGSSVSYYLNGSVSQGTIGGVAYKELNKTPIFGAGTDITINADGYIASFITDALDPNKLLIPAGNWNLETYFSASSSGGSPTFYVELYKYNGTTFTLIATSSGTPELIAFGTNINPYFSTLAVPETVLALTDRLALRYYVTHSGRTITLHTENNHLCQVITTFTTGLTALNGLTSQVQYLTVGTSGTDFAISSATDTHTFNLPTASATNRGALSSADWTIFNNKVSGTGASGQVAFWNGTSSQTGDNGLFWDNTNKRLGVGTNAPLSILDVSGTASSVFQRLRTTSTSASSDVGLRIQDGTTGFTITDGLYLGRASAINYLWTYENEPLVFATNNIERIRLNANGNVGIGTNSPIAQLDVATSTSPIISACIRTTSTSASTNVALRIQDGTTGIGTADGLYLGRASAINYLWTYETEPLVFGTSNSERMRLFANGNIGINTTTDAGFRLDVNGTARVQGGLNVGTQTPTALVHIAAQGTLSTDVVFRVRNSGNTGDYIRVLGNNNVFVGFRAGNVNTGSNVTAYGTDALRNNTSGSSNTAFGADALTSNTTAIFNTAVGVQALSSNTTGADNTAMGALSLSSNNATNNSAFGYAALRLNTSGGSNSAFGENVFSNNTTGSGNIAFGVEAGRFIADGTTDLTIANNSVFLGRDTRAAADNQTNQIVIGHEAIGLGSNTIVLGNTSTTHGRWYGNLLIGTSTNSGFQLDVNGTGRFSSSVTAGGTNYLVNTSTGTATTYQRILNTGGDLILGINNSAGNSLASGGLSYATMMYNNTNTALQFGTNADIKLTITSGGNVLIGTATNGASKLRVVGLPTSSAGLSSGDVWSDSGTLKIA